MDVVDGDDQGAVEERQREYEPGDAVSEKVDNVRLGPSHDLDDRGHSDRLGIVVPRPAQWVKLHRRGQVVPVAGQHGLGQDEGDVRLGGERAATMATAYSSGPVGRHRMRGARQKLMG